ncbi:MAG: HNH endonuclease [Blastocatellia bacterium]|nr:HNH endonuclease [Blastocatellia bacterium]
MAEAISEALRQAVTERARGCCEYCLSQEAYATERFSIEHIYPRALGGLTVVENLALACQGCNGHKSAKTAAADPETGEMTTLFHPRKHRWAEHFSWSDDGLHIVGLTPTGKATIVRLQMNRPSLVNLRRALLSIKVHPPRDLL